ncbi:hypothetical protein [Paraburkholderia strydomiana]|jgi:hypothetical protein|uniref:hypothetical protein n=1 Tax=Paraburkholderia strydomiana TaxID=1245417 RepID=UPI0038BB7321
MDRKTDAAIMRCDSVQNLPGARRWRHAFNFYLAWRGDETDKALRWWVDQLDQPDPTDEFAQQRMLHG